MNDIEIILQHLTNACDEVGKLLKYNFDTSIFDTVCINSSGDKVKKIDILAHDIFEEEFRTCSLIGGIASEEKEEAIIFDENKPYVLIIDPIDGSSNIDINVTVGSIFSVYKSNDKITQKTFLQNGKNIVCAGYSLYGPSTSLIFAHNHKVMQYQVLNGKLELYDDNIIMPNNLHSGVFSMNTSNYFRWSQNVKMLYSELLSNHTVFRYVGSLVAEVHRTIKKGGFYAYPGDSQNQNGKLRLVYECFPMAYIIEAAGGICSNGIKRMLDVVPCTLHEHSPLFLGSKVVMNQCNLS